MVIFRVLIMVNNVNKKPLSNDKELSKKDVSLDAFSDLQPSKHDSLISYATKMGKNPDFLVISFATNPGSAL